MPRDRSEHSNRYDDDTTVRDYSEYINRHDDDTSARDYSGYGRYHNDATANLFTEFKINSPSDIARIITELEGYDIDRINIYSEHVTKTVAELMIEHFDDFI